MDKEITYDTTVEMILFTGSYVIDAIAKTLKLPEEKVKEMNQTYQESQKHYLLKFNTNPKREILITEESLDSLLKILIGSLKNALSKNIDLSEKQEKELNETLKLYFESTTHFIRLTQTKSS